MNEAAASPRTNLLDLDRSGVEDFFVGLGEKRFRAQQVMKWIYHQRVDDFERMTDLGKGLRDALKATPRCGRRARPSSSARPTAPAMWLLGLDGGNAIETVFIPEPTRGTLCVSSQVGCGLNCRFCSTATQASTATCQPPRSSARCGSRRARWATSPTRSGASNVVMMGMGEPLLNFDTSCAR